MTENHDVPLWDQSLLQFRNRVAGGTPTPGGGAVASVTATFGAALLRMVCAIGDRRRPDPELYAIAAKVKIVEDQLARYAVEDIVAFDRYMAARKNRSVSAHVEVQRCLQACTEVPLAAAEAVLGVETFAVEILPRCPESLSSDLETARLLLQATRKALLANVRVNLTEMDDGEGKDKIIRRLDAVPSETA
jgi:formiminotetrahydrofolate cyclodeaminase